jgi:uncharacterized protein YybS (DUF2232 family)
MQQQVAFTVAGITATLLCFLGATQLGPAGAMLNFLTPLPVCYLSLRFGLRVGTLAVVSSAVLLSLLIPFHSLAAYLGLFGFASLLLPLLLKRQLAWDRAVAMTVLAVTATALVFFAVYLLDSGATPGALIDQYLQAEIAQAMQTYQDAGLSAAQLQEMEQIAGQVAAFIASTFFGLYVAGTLAVQLLTLLLLQRFKGESYRIAGLPFARWRLPAVLIWVLILAGFGMLAPLESLQSVARNSLAILLPLYFLQGLAVVNSFLLRKSYPPVLKGMIYLMVFIFNPLPLLVTGVGVFDLWVDFRRPRTKDL